LKARPQNRHRGNARAPLGYWTAVAPLVEPVVPFGDAVVEPVLLLNPVFSRFAPLNPGYTFPDPVLLLPAAPEVELIGARAAAFWLPVVPVAPVAGVVVLPGLIPPPVFPGPFTFPEVVFPLVTLLVLWLPFAPIPLDVPLPAPALPLAPIPLEVPLPAPALPLEPIPLEVPLPMPADPLFKEL
jgi:hypothetical protein